MSTLLLLPLGVVYAVLFWVLALNSPRWALMLIFAVAPFQNDISGGGPLKFSFAEVNLLLSVPVVLLRARRIIFGPTLLPALLYLGTCVFSALGQWRSSTLQSLVQTFIYIVVLVVVFASFARSQEDYRLGFNGLILVSVFLAVSVMATGSPYVYGLHKNGVGAFLAASFVIALELWLSTVGKKGNWLYLGAAFVLVTGSLITLSRGGWMAASVGALVVLGLRGRVGLALKCAVLLVPLIAVAWQFVPESGRQYATGFGGDRWNIQARYESVDYALRVFGINPLQGAGIGLRKDYDATNVLLLSLAETGIPGLLAFLLLNASVVFMVVMSYGRMPRHSFARSLLAIALAVTLGKFVHGLVDHYWGRGTLTAAWATVGMAARAVYDERRERKQRRELKRLAQAKAARARMLLVPGANAAASTPDVVAAAPELVLQTQEGR